MKKTFLALLLGIAFFMITPSMAIVEGTNETIKLNSKIYDELDTYDEVDYFKIKLSKPGSVKIDFEFDVNGKYFVKLINVNTNKVIQNLTFESQVNTPSGRYSMSGNKMRLDEGTYQITVSTNSYAYSDEEYELKVNYDSETSDSYEKELNDTAKNAMEIDYNRKITGNLEMKNDVDYYMLEVEDAGTLQVRLQYNYSSSYNVVLYSETNGKLNQLQNLRFTSGLVNNDEFNIQIGDKIRVPEGNYYVKISNGSWSSYTDEDYVLTIMYSKDRYGNYEEENNNSANTATLIYESQDVVGNLSSNSDVDYYYLELWGDKYFVNMEVPQDAEYNVVIYKEDNGSLKQISSNKIADNNLYIPLENSNGYYYIKVTSRQYSNDDYVISVLNEYQVHIPKTIELEVDNTYMYVDGKKISIDGNRGTKPVVVNGRMLLPASAIVENLGGKVSWNNTTQVATFELKDKVIVMPIGSSNAYVNGQVKYLDVQTTTINGRTMVPVRFVAENLGCNVNWDNGKVTINY